MDFVLMILIRENKKYRPPPKKYGAIHLRIQKGVWGEALGRNGLTLPSNERS